VVLLQWRRHRADNSYGALMARLPADDAVRVFIDVQALRQAGLLDLLAGSRTAEETDYRNFVESTQFDYREDLDAIFASFKSGDLHCLMRGRFEWDQLRRHAVKAKGTCQNGFCRVPADQPDRHVSFYALLPDVLALSISKHPNAAYSMAGRQAVPPTEEDLRHPVWITADASVFSSKRNMPDGTRIFATAMEKAQTVTITLDAANEGYEATLRAHCKSAEEAEQIAKHLEEMTKLLRSFFVRDKQTPNPADLSGVLTAGTFRRENTTVHGRWPIQRVFLQTLAEGKF
jgi:hypothetical protein